MTCYPNLKSQLFSRIKLLTRTGESKYDAKIAYRKSCASKGEKCNNSKTPFLHSYKTILGYSQTINHFCNWTKEHKSDVYASKDINNLDKSICYEYLKERDYTLSPSTITKDISALNKLLDLNLNIKEGNLTRKMDVPVTRSRLDREMDHKYNPHNYKDPIELAQAFGLRRECIIGGDYAVKESSLFTRDGNVFCAVIGKGGKYREAQCLDSFKNSILDKYNVVDNPYVDTTKEEFVNSYRNSCDDVLITKYSTMIDNHAFRGEYARELYTQLAEEKEAEGIRGSQEYYKGYYEDSVGIVSRSMGHERLSVVVISYFH